MPALFSPPFLSRFLKHSRNAFLAAQTNTSGRTDTEAGRLFIFGQPMQAQVALDRDLPLVFKLHGAEGTGFQAFSASDAKIIVNENNTLFISGNRLHRAGLLAGGFGTMVAINGDVIRAFFKHPHQSRSHAQTVFLFAGNFTGMTAHTVLLAN
jgi:hypothetical protein